VADEFVPKAQYDDVVAELAAVRERLNGVYERADIVTRILPAKFLNQAQQLPGCADFGGPAHQRKALELVLRELELVEARFQRVDGAARELVGSLDKLRSTLGIPGRG
jgi:hypothetical protein